MSSFSGFCQDVWAIAADRLLTQIRVKVWVAMEVIEPILWLLLYTQLYTDQVTRSFLGSRTYLDFFIPGLLTMSCFYSASWSGLGMLDRLRSGFINRLLVTPGIALGNCVGIRCCTDRFALGTGDHCNADGSHHGVASRTYFQSYRFGVYRDHIDWIGIQFAFTRTNVCGATRRCDHSHPQFCSTSNCFSSQESSFPFPLRRYGYSGRPNSTLWDGHIMSFLEESPRKERVL